MLPSSWLVLQTLCWTFQASRMPAGVGSTHRTQPVNVECVMPLQPAHLVQLSNGHMPRCCPAALCLAVYLRKEGLQGKQHKQCAGEQTTQTSMSLAAAPACAKHVGWCLLLWMVAAHQVYYPTVSKQVAAQRKLQYCWAAFEQTSTRSNYTL